MTTHRSNPVPLADLLDEWTRTGLLTAEQARALGQDRERRVLVAESDRAEARVYVLEGLGYLGGAVAAAAAITLTSQYWTGLGTAARLAVLAVAWTGLAIAGALLPVGGHRTGARARLRSVLWLASAPAAAAFLGVFGDASLGLRDADLGLLVGVGTSAWTGFLYYRWRAALQQIAALVASSGAAAALIAELTTSSALPGLGPWAIGVTWAILGWSGRTAPARLGLLAGATVAVFGAMVTAGTDAGMVHLIVTLAAIVLACLVLHDPLLLGVGAIGVVVNVPAAVERWFPASRMAPLFLVVTGLVVVALSVVAARRMR